MKETQEQWGILGPYLRNNQSILNLNLFLSYHSIPTINAMYQGRLLLRERLHLATYCCFQSFNPSFK